MFSAKNIVLLTEINGFFDASLLHNYMDVIVKRYFSSIIVTVHSYHRRYDYIKYTFVDPERYKD
ncbi:hypothetical protein G6X37_04365 [Staphylococcus aureus]|nr:hypothetical protein [Staphylococcus aureus]